MNTSKITKKVNLDEDWDEFVKNEGLVDYNKIPLKRAELSGWLKITFWLLRVYILIMIIMVIIGFSRVH